MSLDEWVQLAACGGHLALGMATFVSGKGSPLRMPLTLLCINLFAWNFADWANRVTDVVLWDWLDATASPLAVPLALHVILAFVGKARARWRWLTVAYVICAAISALGFLGLVDPDFRRGFPWKDWARAMVGVTIPVVVGSAASLILHFRRHPDREERTRTILVLAALVIGGGFGLSDVADELVRGIPNLTAAATLCSALLLFLVVLRYRLVGANPSPASIGYLAALSAMAVLLNVMAVVALSTRVAAVAFAATTVTGAVAVLVREFIVLRLRRESRMRELVLLGRMAAQMTHDMNNPLAALKAAAQCIELEMANTSNTPRAERMLRLLVSQADRLRDTVDRYSRLSRLEAVLNPTDLIGVVRRTVDGFAPLRGGPVVAVAGTDDMLPRVNADPGLVALALQNLIENSVYALGERVNGRVDVTLHSYPGPSGSPGMALTVSDNGPGMEARVVEQAWDDFFTTKADGSGLGLAFVRRVMEAHGGTAVLDTRLGRGTTVHLWFPVHVVDESNARKHIGR